MPSIDELRAAIATQQAQAPRGPKPPSTIGPRALLFLVIAFFVFRSLLNGTSIGFSPMYFLLVPLIILVFFGVRIVNQYQIGVVFRLGKIVASKTPGLSWIIPFIDRMVTVDMRTVTLPVPSQKIITRDNVSIDVAAVAYFKVIDPIKALVAIENVTSAINQIAQTTVRNIVGQFPLDDVLAETAIINGKVKEMLDVQTEHWGVQVSVVEIKDIQLPEGMQRAMAKQAEAERERRAKIIAAEGEFQASEKLAQAADVMAMHPIALQLRNLQTLAEIAVEKNSTIIFPNQFMTTVSDVQKFMAQEFAGRTLPPTA